MTLRFRSVAALAALAVVAFLTLGPRAIIAPARRAFLGALDAASVTLSYADAERILNTVMFVPLGAALALLLARRWWPVAVLACVALSMTVEFVQESIPGRVPDAADVLWNSVGGAIGVVAIALVRAVVRGGSRSAT